MNFFVCLIFSACISVAVQDAVKLKLYYESYCSDSKDFINNQLKPAYTALGSQFMEIEFVPYGKSKYESSPGGGYKLTCQHENRECLGNKLQACALHILQAQADLRNYFIFCVMAAQYPHDAAAICSAYLDVTQRQRIETCYHGTEGNDLLIKYANVTKQAVPIISWDPNQGYVPQIEFNGVYETRSQTIASYDLKTIICSKLPDHEKPSCTARITPNCYWGCQVYVPPPPPLPRYNWCYYC